MTRGFVDWQDLGILPLQDHDGVIPPELRQQVVGGRIVKMRDPEQGDPAEEAWVEYGVENDLGTLGDVHPWLFWQTSDTEARGMGSWSMAWGAITTGGGGGGTGRGSRGPVSGGSRGGFFNIGDEILPKPGLAGGGTTTGRRGRPKNVTVQPLADSSANPDSRYIAKTPGWPKCFPAVPQGIEMMVVPGTAESSQQEVMLWADPRLIAPTVEGPAECGTLVVDLQPEAEPCMDGAKEPGIGGRAARLQSAWRVVARPVKTGAVSGGSPFLSDPVQQPGDVVPRGRAGPGLKGIGAEDGNGLAWNLALSTLDKLPGYGMVWAKLDGAGGGTRAGGNRPQQVGGRTRPVGPGRSSPGNAAQGPCKFGEFKARPEQNHGVAFVARMDAWGPIHAGHRNDKHQIDVDRDGHPMNSAHISTDALYYRSREEDGPLYFQGEYPETTDHPLYSDVELVWDEDLDHSWIRGVREGKWRWVAQVPHMAPPTTPPVPPDDEPPPTIPPRRPPTTTPPTVPGGGGPPTFRLPPTGHPPTVRRNDPRRDPTYNFVLPGSGLERDNPESGSRLDGPTDDPRRALATTYERVGQTQLTDRSVYVIHHPFHESFAELSFRPQHWQSGLTDYSRNPRVSGSDVRQEETYRPTTLSMHTWGAQDGPGWDYTDFPGTTRARGGTVSGGVIFAPPGLEMEDYLSGGPGDTTGQTTTSYVALAPSVCLALGEPNTDGGLNAASGTLAQDMSDAANRPLVLSQLNSSRTAVPLITASVNQSSAEVSVAIGGTQALTLPRGTTAQQPSAPSGGEIRVNSSGANDVVEFWDEQGSTWTSLGSGGGGSTTFTGLTDTPANYTSSAGYLVRVNATPNALEFVDGTTIFQPLDSELTAIAGLTSAADRLPYFTGSGTASLATFTSFARTILDDADAATVRTTIDAAQTSHTHATTDITSGTFADARIAESNVTQHEAALTILETQITDGSLLARLAAAETVSGVWTFDPNAGTNQTTNFENSGAGNHSVQVDGTFVLTTGAFTGTIRQAGLTANRTYTVPDATGTVALTSDIVDTFAALTDGPGGYGSSGDVLVSSGSAVAWETPTTTSAGVANAGDLVRLLASGRLDNSLITFPAFTGLTEGPGAFTGNAGEFMRVNGGETALEYVDLDTLYLPLAGGTMTGDIQSAQAIFDVETTVGAIRVIGKTTALLQAATDVTVEAVGGSATLDGATGVTITAAGNGIDVDGEEVGNAADATSATSLATLGQLQAAALLPISGGRTANGITAAQYMLGGAADISTQFRSPPLPWDARLVAVGTFIVGTVTNTDIIVRRNGTDIVTVSRTSADTYPTGTITTVSDDSFGAGDMPQIYLDPTPGSDSINAPIVTLYFRKRT